VNNTNIKLFIGILLFSTWLALVVFKVPDTGDIISGIKLALAGLGVYHLGDRPIVSVTTSPPDKQSGRALLGLLVALAVGTVILLSGCASFQQALNGYESAALVSTRAANDNVIAVWSTTACATPVSAALRNPQIIPALKVLCMSGGDTTPASLLDAMQAQRPPAK
jgi:uncharacterized protein YceK